MATPFVSPPGTGYRVSRKEVKDVRVGAPFSAPFFELEEEEEKEEAEESAATFSDEMTKLERNMAADWLR